MCIDQIILIVTLYNCCSTDKRGYMVPYCFVNNTIKCYKTKLSLFFIYQCFMMHDFIDCSAHKIKGIPLMNRLNQYLSFICNRAKKTVFFHNSYVEIKRLYIREPWLNEHFPVSLHKSDQSIFFKVAYFSLRCPYIDILNSFASTDRDP